VFLILCFRFLLARNGDVAAATELLRNHLIWKAANMPVSKATCLNEMRKGKLYMHGFDKEGHPLMIWRASRHNALERDMDEMLRMCIWWFQYVRFIYRVSAIFYLLLLFQADSVMPPNKSKLTMLCDRSDYGSNSSDIEFVKASSKVMQDNFPERLHKCIIYPSGLVCKLYLRIVHNCIDFWVQVFWGLWNVVKWFLDPVTQAKASPIVYLSGVQQFIDDEYIPERLGGTSKYEFDHEHFSDPETEESSEKPQADAT
jgi:hypothetical protein